jgi:Polysaccharide lyase family 4, domain II
MRMVVWWQLAIFAAHAADIHGKVALASAPLAEAVVSIECLRLQAPRDRAILTIDHHDLNFVPRVLIGRPGITVQFKNSDGMPCRLYSISPSGVFVLRREDARPMSMSFDRPGIIHIRCSEHAKMHAYVVIKENPYFSLTDANGRYRIANVPPGRYNLQAWRDGEVVGTKEITVKTAKLKVDFQASPPIAAGARTESYLPEFIFDKWRQE